MVQLGHDQLPFDQITEDDCHSLDKAWHVLHYLMTGSEVESDGPLGFLLSGGLSVGVQVGGGDMVPRVFLTDKAATIAEQISGLAVETLAERFNWPEMMRRQVYPEIRIAERFPQQLWNDYLGQFFLLREFLQETKAMQRGFTVSFG